jgi:hypothetical protein
MLRMMMMRRIRIGTKKKKFKMEILFATSLAWNK